MNHWGWGVAAAVVNAAVLMLLSQKFIHMLQLESYQLPGYRRVMADNGARQWTPLAIAATVGCVAIVVLFLLLRETGVWIALAAIEVSCAIIYLLMRRKKDKKPLVYTARVKRLLMMHGALLLVLSLFFVVTPWVWRGYPFFCLPLMFLPWCVAVSACCLQPIERRINRMYFREAQKKLATLPCLRIGITGSYGKTSAKFILRTILSERYRTYATPSSYNTPMGVTRVIREEMGQQYEVFIAEMGARHVGDIAEMCELVAPQYGLITSVGPQHLETFGSLENVAKTKYELIEALPADGVAFLPDDGAIGTDYFEKTDKRKISFGLPREGAAMPMVSARDIEVSSGGSRFLLVLPDGLSAPCQTRLLGRHNIANILGGCAVAHCLGLTAEEIARGIGKIEPVEHRLQLIDSGNGVIVIDDAFNANPSGVRAAMEVLGSFPGRKIVVTPGMVELGEDEAMHNESFGRLMAEVADVAILVGIKRTEPIAKGLREAGFAQGNIIVTARLEEATAQLAKLTRAGDVVLFENDLPDQYEE